MRSIAATIAIALLVFACGDGGSSVTGSTTTSVPSTSGPGDSAPIRGLVVLGMFQGDVTGEAGTSAAVVGDVIETSEETRACGSVMDSYPPQCSIPDSVRLEGADVGDLPDTETASGVTWTRSSVVVIGEWTDDGSIAVDRLLPIVIGDSVTVAGIIENRDGRWVLCTAPEGACDVTAVPLVGFAGPASGGASVVVAATWDEGGLNVGDVLADGG